jgi:type II secretory pathway component PulF
MAKFSYRARRGDGKTEKGIIEALDREDLVRKLRSDNKFLIEASEQRKREEGNRIIK